MASKKGIKHKKYGFQRMQHVKLISIESENDAFKYLVKQKKTEIFQRTKLKQNTTMIFSFL